MCAAYVKEHLSHSFSGSRSGAMMGYSAPFSLLLASKPYLLGCSDDKATRKTISVFFQEAAENSDLVLTPFVVESKQNNFAVWILSAVDLLAEVFVIYDQNSLFLMRTTENLRV